MMRDSRRRDVRWWAPVLGVAIVVGLALLDSRWTDRQVIAATVVIAPFLTAMFGTPRATAFVGAGAVIAAIVSGSWNDNYGHVDYVVRLLVVMAGSAFAVAAAHSRMRMAIDRRRFRLLSAAADISDHSGPVDETVHRLVDLLVPELADICVIDVVRSGDVERLAVAACGPGAQAIEDGLRRRAEAAAGRAPGDARAAMRSGTPVLIDSVDERVLRKSAHDDDDLRFLRSLRTRSTIIVPLRARGEPIGAMALMVGELSGRSYGSADLEFAQVLSGRVALALDNAGLFSEVESLEARQSAVLGSLAEAVTLQNAAGELVYANEAAARLFGYGSAAELLAAPPSAIFTAYDSFNEDGTPVRLEQLPGRRVLSGEQPEPLLVRALVRETGEERWRIVKATAVRDREGRPRLAVNVIEDVTEVKRAEIAQRMLARASELLASSLDYEETLAQVARLAVPRLADWCGVALPDEHGRLRSVAVAHADPEKVAFAAEYNRRYPTRLDDEGGPAQVMRDGAPVLVNDISDAMLAGAVTDPEQLAELRKLGMRSIMIVPMVAATAGVIGTITLVSAESRRTFTDADLALAEELGRRAGTAVENARLYTERSHIAQTLQASLLPDDLPEIPDFALASLYRPAGEENFVGGDFYDAFQTRAGWMLLVGDVTGRGAEAAALTAQMRHTLHTAGALLGDPAAAVAQLNRALLQRRDVSICTAAIVLLADSGATTSATVLCAGHPPPLLIRDGEARQIGASGPVLGAWEQSAWETATLELQPGDVLLLYTDGVTDARGRDERFGEQRLAAAVRSAESAAGAVAAVRSALEAFECGPQADDTAVVAVQRLPAPVAAPPGAPSQVRADRAP